MRTHARRQHQSLFLTLAGALALSGSAHAGTNIWTSSTPSSGDVRAFAIDPLTPSTVYAGTYGGGVFKSTDAGGTWAGASAGLAGLSVVALAVNPALPSTLYAATNEAGVFKSTDAGNTWAGASAGLPIPRTPDIGRTTGLYIDPLTPTTLYCIGLAPYGSIFKSTDAGASWVLRATGITGLWSMNAFAIDPSAPATLYAGTGVQGDGVFKSTNGGDTWAVSNGGLILFTQSTVMALAVDPSNSAIVYVAMQDDNILKSTNAGATWAPSHAGIPGNVRALAIDPSLPTTLYAGTLTGAGVYKSTNSGATWTASNAGLASPVVHALAIVPGSSSTVYAGAEGGAFKSTNSGGNWANVSAGLANSSFVSIAVAPSNPASMYAGAGLTGQFSFVMPLVSLVRSTDSGSTWTPANAGLPASAVKALAVDPLASSTVYAGTAIEGTFKSTDAGNTWGLAESGLPAGSQYRNVRSLVIDPLTPANVYAGTYGGLCKSTDSGATWSVSNNGLTPVSITALAIDSTTPATLYAGTGTGVYRSTDSGATWTAANAGIGSLRVDALALDPTTPTVLYAGGPASTAVLFKSTNSGTTWAAANTGLPSGAVNAVVVNPASASTLYAGTRSAGVFKSTSAGATWAPVNKGLPPSAHQVQALALNASGATTLYAAAAGVGLWQATPPPPAFVKGDVDGDSQADVVFRSNLDGTHNKVWLMNGVARTAEAPIVPDAANAGWKVRGVDDFDGDGGNDLVFWNQASGNVEFWLMNATSRAGSARALANGAVLDPAWDLSATADFDHDGRADIVWRSFATQKIAIWKMGGLAQLGTIATTPDQAVDGNWIVVAALDYDNDGNTDFLWYNFSSGRIVTWYMNASVARTTGQFTTPNAAGDSNWKVVASSDYSGTSVPATPPLGSPDIVWRNETSGNQVVWHMDFASTRVHGEFTNPAANSPALDWTIVGPR